MIKSLISTEINSSSYTPIVDPGAQPGKPLGYYLVPSDGQDFYIASKPDGSDGVLWPLSSGPAPSFGTIIHPDENGILCYVKGTTSTTLLLVRQPG